jgi:hypothetical protein
MRGGRILGVCIGAMLASCATGATASLAAPPEFSPPFPNAFTSTSKAMTLETVGKFRVTCTADTTSGQVTGPATALVTITFTGCSTGEGAAFGQCQNGVAGEVATQRLSGTLGYLNRKHTAVGLDLSNPTGGPMARFSCGEDTNVEMSGSAIGRVSPIDKTIAPGEHITLKFAEKEGHQAIKRLLGGALDVPLTKVLFGPLEESGVSSIDVLTFAAPVEVIA